MNILTDALPCELVICGQNCHIKSDFKTWIKVSCLLEKNMKDPVSGLVDVFALIFETLPPRFEEAIIAIMDFYNPRKAASAAIGEKRKNRIYDFEYDADLIYAAFLQQYRIDLCTEKLHWWQFKALFDSLTEETQFVKVMQYRSVELSTVTDKKQKQFYHKMKRLYRLPDNRTEEEKEQAIVDAFIASFA